MRTAEMTDEFHEARRAVAWDSAARLLRDGGWRSWALIVQDIAEATGLDFRECSDVLLGACRDGHLVRQSLTGEPMVRTTLRGVQERPELRSSRGSGMNA